MGTGGKGGVGMFGPGPSPGWGGMEVSRRGLRTKYEAGMNTEAGLSHEKNEI